MISKLDVLVALVPLLFLVYLMMRKNPVPSAMALPLAALLTYIIRLSWFGTDTNLLNASVISGVLLALTPIMIVWGAIFLFQTMERCGSLATIRTWLNHISSNRVAQVVIIGWSFQFLIEGASGFGTPAALAGPLLVGLKFPPLKVVIACLILNTVPVSFGAVGTPIWFGFGQLGLSAEEMQSVAWKTAVIHSIAALVIPVIAFRFLLSWSEIRKNLGFIYLALASSVVPMLLFARLGNEFPAVAGGLIGLTITVWLAKRGVGLTPESESGLSSQPELVSSKLAVVKALFPLWATTLVLLVTRIPELGLRGLLTSDQPGWDFSVGALGDFSISPSLVIGVRGILGTDMNWSHQTLYVPSLIPFVLIAAISWRFLKAPQGTAAMVWRESTGRMRRPVFALAGALVFVRLLMVDGDRSSVMIMADSAAALTGSYWQFVAAYLGALGSFVAGSNSISNLTFGPVQDVIATQMGLDRTTILSLQSVGGAMGNMIAIHNIVAICSVLGLGNHEGEILKKTLVPAILYGAIAGAISLAL